MESNETDDIEMEGAVEEETMEGKEGEEATKVQGAKLLPHHPSPQVVELQRVESELGRQLTKDEEEFVASQLEQKAIQSIKAAKRSDEQSMRLRKLQNFINHAKKQLQNPLLIIQKAPAKTMAQKKASSRARMSTPEREAQKEATRVRMATPEQREATRVRMATPEQREAARVRMATPEQKEADRVRLGTLEQREAARVRMATPEQKEADRVRLATPEQREAARVRMVVARAGGLSEDRKRDVEAGRIKNKKSSVYSGDALRNNEVFQGTFIIPALEEDEEDALGQLGNTECRHCGALR